MKKPKWWMRFCAWLRKRLLRKEWIVGVDYGTYDTWVLMERDTRTGVVTVLDKGVVEHEKAEG